MNADSILDQAVAATGLKDIGDATVMEALGLLVEASNREAQLTDDGARRWEAMLVGTLANRLKIIDYLKRHPELAERQIEKPMFVFGLPRTGTTLTINLLSADPARRCLLRWEALDPVPPAKFGALHSDPRYAVEQARLDMVVKHAPQIAAAHYEDADSPTECQYAMALSFCSQIFDSQINIPSYRRWFFDAPYLPAFRFHKQLLQLLQAENGGQWTLKNPWHPLYLDALTEVYPDAQLVMTHRDPIEVVGSACSLIRLIRPMFSRHLDLRQIAEQLLETFDLMIARQNAFRDEHGEDAIYDIQYRDQLADPVGVMKSLYERFGTEFTTAAEAGMHRLLAENPKGKHGAHAYSLEEFGLTEAGVRHRFRDYCERFRIQ